jgi:tetratricopeptide (TPR) repeat protein
MLMSGLAFTIAPSRITAASSPSMPATPRRGTTAVGTGRLLGRLEEALADCNEALRLAPDGPGTLDSRGFTYLKLGRFEQAIADYDAALARNPRQPSSLYGRGIARLRNDPEGGRADLTAAKALDRG